MYPACEALAVSPQNPCGDSWGPVPASQFTRGAPFRTRGGLELLAAGSVCTCMCMYMYAALSMQCFIHTYTCTWTCTVHTYVWSTEHAVLYMYMYMYSTCTVRMYMYVWSTEHAVLHTCTCTVHTYMYVHVCRCKGKIKAVVYHPTQEFHQSIITCINPFGMVDGYSCILRDATGPVDMYSRIPTSTQVTCIAA